MSADIELITWNEPGEFVAGRLVEIRNGREFPNRQSRAAEFRRKNGSAAVAVLTRTLEAQLKEEGVRPGSRVKITYLGLKMSKGRGYPFKQFRIETRP